MLEMDIKTTVPDDKPDQIRVLNGGSVVLPRVVVLISGGGSNLQALMDATQRGTLQAEIVLVVSNRKAAFGLERARSTGLDTLYFPLKPYRDAGKSRQEYDTDLTERVAQARPDLIVLAGWMHIDSGPMIDRFPGRIINLHPALPGEFPGAHAIEDAYNAWREGRITRSGCMVHHVIRELDAGPVIAQREVGFQPGDTLESFSARLHAAEHGLIIQATNAVLNEKILGFQAIKP
jgi:formyltetrahydrofolate-dependent phosphoribosylglycinamide formyltransferase